MTGRPIRVHLGGQQVKAGWEIVDAVPNPHVDHVGSCVSLPWYATGTVDEVYASHVLEHLGYRTELPRALREVHRILKPGGRFCISVPDFEILCKLFVHPDVPAEERFSLMLHVFGDQTDDYDFHKIGLTFDFLLKFLGEAGFSSARRVEGFGLFDDYSTFKRFGVPISLNVEAFK